MPRIHLPSPVSTPFTFWYLAVLLATTGPQHLFGESVSARLLELASTDAHNLWHRPVLSLVSSALWLGDDGWLVYVVIFTLAVAPLERRIGAGWTCAVFASGHVLATLATELPVMAAIAAGWLPVTDGRWLDIGVSYGFFATAGALVPVLARRFRAAAVLAIETGIVVIYLIDQPTSLGGIVTFAGHLIAAHIGLLGWSGWLRRHGFAGTLPRPARRGGRVRPLAGSVAP
ncbi:hypothetical protein GCM10027445_21510 [Amycolatopsis endophytica]|uniref:Uncharacterized protein n=1 Tax=Amycolatopsis endophytica TaxID=860233 RepID=A0A853BC51_9PSEU|nr:rhomboid-like protein [Amycolatopsis endophytica]NYI92953.1 hypothetical protein [Amycolatopsis endophytica]